MSNLDYDLIDDTYQSNFGANVEAVIDFEVDRYRFRAQGLPLITDGIHNDPLAWLKDNSAIFPHFSALARRLLYVPAASASSERVFLSAGLTIGNSRARMLPELSDDVVFM